MLAEQTTSPPLDRLQAVADRDDVLGAIAAAGGLRRGRSVGRYAVEMTSAHAREPEPRAGRQPAGRDRAAPHGEGARGRGRP